MDLTVTVAGLESIDQDLKAEIVGIQNAVNYALYDVYQNTEKALIDHIEKDVYKKFTPREYPRRSENPGKFGPPLTDMKTNLDYQPLYGKGAMWGGFSINYLPSGEHTGTTADLPVSSDYYDPDNPKPIKAYPKKGDRTDDNDLIRRIETGKGYTWRRRPGKREFWQQFVNEMTDQNKFAEYFVAAMLSQGYVVENDTDVIRDPSDGKY